MVRECSNLTLEEGSEYGTYCFEHSHLTNSPINSLNKEVSMKLKSVTISLGKMNRPFDSAYVYSSSRSEKKVMSAPRKIPVVLDNHKRIKTVYEKMKCCVCQEDEIISNKMECGHLLCLECLDHARSIKCPLCFTEMKGNLISSKIKKEIGIRYREDIDERGEEDTTMSNIASLGYNPEKLDEFR
jgi:hypothetical protein